MKKFVIAVFCCLVLSLPAFAQNAFPEFDKIKQIRLLESTREDVRRIFGDLTNDFADLQDEPDEDEEDDQTDQFSRENIVIRVSYSLGTCSDDDEEEWNVANGKVTEINVFIRNSDESPEYKIDLSKLERINERERDAGEEEEEEDPDDFIYLDKEKNVSYGLSDGKINTIKFMPAEKDFPALCSNETVREFATNKEWLLAKIKDRFFISDHSRPFANVADLVLSKTEFTTDCPAAKATETVADFDYAKIEIATTGESADPTDVLTYNYLVSAGKIVGSGANVVWDLSGVKPGTYTITAGVDNGCGVCGTTKTVTVRINEPFCPQKKN